MSDELCGLALQGPNSRRSSKALGVSGIDKLPHFGIMEATVDGHWMRIDRAGYTGDLGYEVWVKPEDALWLWDTLLKVGEPYKIAPMGGGARTWRGSRLVSSSSMWITSPRTMPCARRSARSPSRPASAGPWI